jgi:signal transduction histidine kinase
VGAIRGPVLILAPVAGDTDVVSHVLTQGGFSVRPCADVLCFIEALGEDAAAAVIAEEALTEPGSVQRLAEALGRQPDWSDLPVILLAGASTNEDAAWALAQRLKTVGNISILERPLRRSTLLNAAGVALRARARQHELREHKEHLEGMVEERTEQLADSMRQLQAKERLAALGTLAAGLGHDISNLVMPIRMHLEVLEADCPSDQVREDVGAIRTALQYLTNLSAGLRLMALDPSREAASSRVDDLSGWWSQAQSVLRGVLPKHVRLEGDLPPGIGVRASAHRLTQAVFNLVQNAGEALASTTDAVVRVTAEPIGPPGAARMVRLRISDNGPGMTPNVVRRCFEPYFSTKGRTISTGMGLAMVRGVTEAAGGGLQVHSELGRGATFTMTLPAVDHAPFSAATGTPGPTPKTAALSIADPKAARIAAMLLEGLDLSVVRLSGSAKPESPLWIVQDPPWPRIEDYLSRCPGGRVIVLRSDGAATVSAQNPAHPIPKAVTVLPLSAPPSTLRQAITTALRNHAP